LAILALGVLHLSVTDDSPNPFLRGLFEMQRIEVGDWKKPFVHSMPRFDKNFLIGWRSLEW
jgi:hypothetical protein